MGLGEDGGGEAIFDHVAQIHKGGIVADAGGLLHVVSNDKHGEFTSQFVDQILDLGGRDGIEGRAGLIQQQYFGGQRLWRERCKDVVVALPTTPVHFHGVDL